MGLKEARINLLLNNLLSMWENETMGCNKLNMKFFKHTCGLENDTLQEHCHINN